LAEHSQLVEIAAHHAKPGVEPAEIIIKLCVFIRTSGHTDATDLIMSLQISSKVLRVGKKWLLFADGAWKARDAIAVGRFMAEPIRELLIFANDVISNDDGPFKNFGKENLSAYSRLGKNGFLNGILTNLGSLELMSRPDGYNLEEMMEK
jgi:hypothetical protein